MTLGRGRPGARRRRPPSSAAVGLPTTRVVAGFLDRLGRRWDGRARSHRPRAMLPRRAPPRGRRGRAGGELTAEHAAQVACRRREVWALLSTPRLLTSIHATRGHGVRACPGAQERWCLVPDRRLGGAMVGSLVAVLEREEGRADRHPQVLSERGRPDVRLVGLRAPDAGDAADRSLRARGHGSTSRSAGSTWREPSARAPRRARRRLGGAPPGRVARRRRRSTRPARPRGTTRGQERHAGARSSSTTWSPRWWSRSPPDRSGTGCSTRRPSASTPPTGERAVVGAGHPGGPGGRAAGAWSAAVGELPVGAVPRGRGGRARACGSCCASTPRATRRHLFDRGRAARGRELSSRATSAWRMHPDDGSAQPTDVSDARCARTWAGSGQSTSRAGRGLSRRGDGPFPTRDPARAGR